MTVATSRLDPMPAGGARAAAVGGEHLAPLLLGALAGGIVAGRIETALGCVAIALVVAVAAGAERPSSRWLAVGLSGALLAALMNTYLTAGRPVESLRAFALFGHAPTDVGVRNAIVVASRLVAATVAILGLRAAWPGERAADELARLVQPLERIGVPVRAARAVLALALRFAPLLASEWTRTARLQAMRAGRPPRGIAERMQRRRATLVPTLVGAFERAERTAMALEARHYRMRPLPQARAYPMETVAGWLVLGAALLWR